MSISKYQKQPSESLDFDFDFNTWMPAGDSLPASITSSVMTADSGITLGTRTHPGSNVVKQFISGGTSGTVYKLTCTITTTQNRIKESEILIVVENS